MWSLCRRCRVAVVKLSHHSAMKLKSAVWTRPGKKSLQLAPSLSSFVSGKYTGMGQSWAGGERVEKNDKINLFTNEKLSPSLTNTLRYTTILRKREDEWEFTSRRRRRVWGGHRATKKKLKETQKRRICNNRSFQLLDRAVAVLLSVRGFLYSVQLHTSFCEWDLIRWQAGDSVERENIEKHEEKNVSFFRISTCRAEFYVKVNS